MVRERIFKHQGRLEVQAYKRHKQRTWGQGAVGGNAEILQRGIVRQSFQQPMTKKRDLKL